MKIALVALISWASVAAGSAQAQELWNGVALGMTPREVLRVLPGAQATSDPSNKASFGELLVAMPGVDVFDHSGRAEFYFERNRLTTVRLFVEPQDLTQQSNQMVIEKIQAELGRPPECVLMMMLCSWRLPTRTVAFSAGGLEPPSALGVEYTGPSRARAR
ncbi:hypothetical protein [Brevundimonas sp. Root1279]|uniref:hypothetical protein n=1 Tax=Brevundimonas sp. Root1279 TaxID=1736443 RepID=UPI0006FF400C|nr:hypothetical protein [Brevundimonas sp. Root1279]KQW82438.1 hypothetical protein ASC65_09340 [Brevundimonas sp. Root1279]